MSKLLLLPDGLICARTTDVLDEARHPSGLRRAHQVADGVWARLVVQAGSLLLVFEDQTEDLVRVSLDAPAVIPPGRPHHVEFDGPVSFVLEFYREERAESPNAGHESGGLVDRSTSF